MTDEPQETILEQPTPPGFRQPRQQALFNEFFESGLEETVSPFLTPTSRKWGKSLHLKASFLASFFLIIAFILSFTSLAPLGYVFLVGTYFFAGIPALISSIEDLVNWEINIDVLMTLAAFFSILIGSGFEGALLLVLFSLSGAMEDAVTTKAKSAISSLKKIAPSKAYVVQADGSVIEKSVKDVLPGHLILIKSGEVIPLDGKVVSGTSSVNLVHLTGENMPITKTVGNEIAAGGVNIEGSLTLEVIHTSSDSTLARIIELITEAQEAKPKLQRMLDSLTNGYARTIILLSFLFAVLLPFFVDIPYLGTEGSIYRALAFLIAASPCALIIAIPIAYLSAVSSCAKQGILLKGGMILDALAKCKAIAFDKTGTLTKGELAFIGIESLDQESILDDEPLRIAYSLEINAVHPIAHAIVHFAKEKNLAPLALTYYRQIPGYGVEGVIERENKKCYLGQPQYILNELSSQQKQQLTKKLASSEKNGEILSLLKIDGRLFYFRFKDTLRPNIKPTLQKLRYLGLKLFMLTGDHEASAKAIAKEIDLNEVYANLRPEDKLTIIENLSKESHLAMVGDGINDAPALARATVGISMGKGGSATAINASDIVLLQNNIELLEWLFKKAKKTQRIVRENLFLALLAIIFATLPALLGWIPLWLAVVLHEGGTVLVALNALRLLGGANRLKS